MSTKHKHEKKTNVINRTTSETLRLGESDLRVLPQSASTSLSIQSLPQSRKKIQSSSSSFQITGVSMTRLDFGDDSADDLDESHTDDISRVTDNETPSFSEDSRDTDDHPAFEAPGLAAPMEPPQAEVKPKPPDEEAGARFKVVKMPSTTPFNRGRWTCFDYLDNSETNLNYIYSEQKPFKRVDNQVTRPPSQATQIPGQGSFTFPSTHYDQPLYTTDVPMEPLVRDNSFLAYISPHYVTVQQNSNIANKPAGTVNTCFPQGYSSILSEGIQASDGSKFSPEATPISRQDSVIEQNQKAATQPSNANGQKDDILSDIKVALTSTPASNSGSAPNNNNIDRKIEEALDAVKTHLMVAVHKEVDFLKTRVSTLEGRVNELEIENSILRVNYLLFKS